MADHDLLIRAQADLLRPRALAGSGSAASAAITVGDGHEPDVLGRDRPELSWAHDWLRTAPSGSRGAGRTTSMPDATRFVSLVSNRHVGRVPLRPGQPRPSSRLARRRRAPVLRRPRHAAPRGVSRDARRTAAACTVSRRRRDLLVRRCAELDGMRIMHGHYIAPHITSSDWRLMDRLAWYLTARWRAYGAAHRRRLRVPHRDRCTSSCTRWRICRRAGARSAIRALAQRRA